MAEYDQSRVELVKVARQLAEVGTAGASAGQEDRYLERFRAIYDHLAATVCSPPRLAGSNRRGDASMPTW